MEGDFGAELWSHVCSTHPDHPVSHPAGWGPSPKWEPVCRVPAILNITTSLTHTSLLDFLVLYSNAFSIVAHIKKRNHIVNNLVAMHVG